ncbi:lipoprotein insertase outer membrane protein LolB [Thermomonas hydrothermalis]|uniref:Outer-membrane lipoprotein LolB n=1 Tax=Thermomonas hydrothermalis TaxID=213588 RepID=A0A1M4S4E1_9GAMM|nr:lipoprotein insertase outer membrane protein LolB [Thermomonas hydrothermalis]SHE27074.1 outer membrane lipoprotein LolB [Thermomonas hydrothermalis]
MRRLALLLAAGLAGCASLPSARPAGDADAGAQVHRQRLEALGLAEGDCLAPVWQLSGRVALANGRQGGSGRIDWAQGGGAVQLQVTAPVTRQGWQLTVDAQGATLSGLDGGPRQDSDPQRLLREAVGWDVPLAALGCWLRGAPAGEAEFGPARVIEGRDRLPQRIEQAGWVVDYAGWVSAPAEALPLPTRIEARRGEARVRLLVDHWGAE